MLRNGLWSLCLFEHVSDGIDDRFRSFIRNVVTAVGYYNMPPSSREMREAFVQLKFPRMIVVEFWILFLALDPGREHHDRKVAIVTPGTRQFPVHPEGQFLSCCEPCFPLTKESNK